MPVLHLCQRLLAFTDALSLLQMRYANNSQYKNDRMIRKECFVQPTVLDELKKVIEDSEVSGQAVAEGRRLPRTMQCARRLSVQILKEDDSNWPLADRVGTQELEIILGQEHISFKTTKLGSLVQVNNSKDPEGLRVFYYLVQVRPHQSFILFLLHQPQ